jgi:uncharacterized membrane protein YphA (DoxX/SURF4 family)
MTRTQQPSKLMNASLWTAQAVLAVSFMWAGGMKLFQSPNELARMWAWTADNASLVKLTGVLDVLAAIGLILPGLLRIQPQLTIFTAYGTIALMVAASIFHIARGESSLIGVNIIFAMIVIFIAWGRATKAPR